MRFPWSKKQPEAASASVIDRAKLSERCSRAVCILTEVASRKVANAKSPKAARRVFRSLHSLGDEVDAMTEAQLIAFLDLVEASTPEDLKDFLR